MEGNISLLLEDSGNLLEQFLDDKKQVELIRVYPYESRCGDIIFSTERKYIERDQTIKDLKVLEVIDALRVKATEQGWNDNKIVIESFVGIWRIFVGYWDDVISVGLSVKPNYRYNPKCKITSTGSVERIRVR